MLCLQHPQFEIVGLEDAAVTKAAGLSAGGELHQAGWEGAGAVWRGIDGERDTLLTPDDIAIAGCDVPYFERYALDDLLNGEAAAPVWYAGLYDACALCHAAKF